MSLVPCAVDSKKIWGSSQVLEVIIIIVVKILLLIIIVITVVIILITRMIETIIGETFPRDSRLAQWYSEVAVCNGPGPCYTTRLLAHEGSQVCYRSPEIPTLAFVIHPLRVPQLYLGKGIP